jgi:hypothetical protein
LHRYNELPPVHDTSLESIDCVTQNIMLGMSHSHDGGELQSSKLFNNYAAAAAAGPRLSIGEPSYSSWFSSLFPSASAGEKRSSRRSTVTQAAHSAPTSTLPFPPPQLPSALQRASGLLSSALSAPSSALPFARPWSVVDRAARHTRGHQSMVGAVYTLNPVDP